MPSPPRPARRLVRRVVVIALVVVALAWLALPWLAGRDAVRRRVAAALSEATGYDVTVDRLRVGWGLGVTLDGLRVAAPSAAPFLMARQVRVYPGLGTLLHGRARRIDLEAPVASLDALPHGSEDGRPMAIALPADAIAIVDGHVRTGPGEDAVVLGPLGMTIDRVEAVRGLEIGGRDGTADGTTRARWSARLGTDLGSVDAKLHVRFSAGSTLATAGHATIAVRGDPRDTLVASLRAVTESTTGSAGSTLAASATLDVPARRGRVEAHLPDDGVAVGGWRVFGSVAAPFRLEPDVVVATPSATVGFQDAESLRIGERVRIDGTVRVPRAAPSSELTVDLRAHAGEVLWDRFFLELARQPVSARGTIGRDGGDVTLRALALSLGDAGTVTLDGRTNPAGGVPRLTATIDIADLAPLFEVAVREPFGDTYPMLAGATLAGRAGGTLRITGTTHPSLTGRLRLSAVSGAITDPALSVSAIDAELPVSLGPAAEAPSDPAGHVRVVGLVAGGMRIPEIQADLRVAPNEIHGTDTVRVSLFGGYIDVNDFATRALDTPDRSARFGLVVRDVDLAAVSTALGWPKLRGGVSAEIPTVTVANGAIRTEGALDARIFGGRLRARNLHVDELWSPVPAIGLDVDFEEVSLGAMTEALDVGQITGVVRGSVHDLSIVNGQPVRLVAELESVPRDGVSQQISVRAIRQISIVAGPGGDALSSGILSFFDRYGYARLGLRCSLENDRFVLRGIDEQDGKQVLVEGSFLPPRVNVYSESQVIGFSEMVRRLRRAVETGAEGGSR